MFWPPLPAPPSSSSMKSLSSLVSDPVPKQIPRAVPPAPGMVGMKAAAPLFLSRLPDVKAISAAARKRLRVGSSTVAFNATAQHHVVACAPCENPGAVSGVIVPVTFIFFSSPAKSASAYQQPRERHAEDWGNRETKCSTRDSARTATICTSVPSVAILPRSQEMDPRPYTITRTHALRAVAPVTCLRRPPVGQP